VTRVPGAGWYIGKAARGLKEYGNGGGSRRNAMLLPQPMTKRMPRADGNPTVNVPATHLPRRSAS
jgi:hypothetical protein